MKVRYSKDITIMKTMHLLVDFAQKVVQYNPQAKMGSEEDNRYWVRASKITDRIAKKHKIHPMEVETQFDNDNYPVFITKTNKGVNYEYDSQGKLKRKVKQENEPALKQKKKGWFW